MASSLRPIILEQPSDVAGYVSGFVYSKLEMALEQRGEASLVLAGGSTFQAAYRLFAHDKRFASLNWSAVSVYFGDERYVPSDDPRSNFASVQEAWFSKVSKEKLPKVFRIRTELSEEEAVADYEAVIPERFDVVLLGMGSDGHTASLFPGYRQSWDGISLVMAMDGSLEPFVRRISLTERALKMTSYTLVAATGNGKAEIVKNVIEDPGASFPVTQIGISADLVLDREAGSLLG